MSEFRPLPDAEQVVRVYLQELGLADSRVYTAWPAQSAKDETGILIRRYDGAPPYTRPLVLDQAILQIDCYGGPKVAARALAADVQVAIAELAGVRTATVDGEVAPVAVVTGTTVGALRYVPDESWDPARPRYVLDATVYLRTPGGAPAGSSPEHVQRRTQWPKRPKTSSSPVPVPSG